ncbi:MAG: DUF4412 domain-containing protein [bacterium]|nr:DUF4412 domain-containing protein [bacterium]
MRQIKLIGSIVFMIVALALSASAGVLMISQASPDITDVTDIKMYLDKNCMRIDTKARGEEQSFIFRKDKETFWVVNYKEKSFIEMTKKDLRVLKAKMEEAIKVMEEQMKNLPPEQKEMLEKMMKGQMPGNTPKIVYKKISAGEKVNKWVCNKYEGYIENNKEEEIWTTDWEKLGLSVNDFKVMQDVSEFIGEFSKGLGASFYKVGIEENKQSYIGIPIKTINYSGKEVVYTTELKEIQKQDLASSLFDVPAGFKKTEMPTGEE